jgi:hypothetical protein
VPTWHCSWFRPFSVAFSRAPACPRECALPPSEPSITDVRRRVKWLAFIDRSPDARLMPVILVHGSPGTSSVFGSARAALAPGFRVIVPDLPGFGASTHELSDYSFRAHAHYILELLDELQVRKPQLLVSAWRRSRLVDRRHRALTRGVDCIALGDRRSGARTIRELHGKPRSSWSTARGIVAVS